MYKLLGEKWKRYTYTSALIAEFIALRALPTRFKPDAIIAGMPVYHVQKEGHASSDELLKYRAMGTIFLAHQKGGKRTFKCTLLMEGTSRLYILGFFQSLLRFGRQRSVQVGDFFKNFDSGTTQVQESTQLPVNSSTKLRFVEHETQIEKGLVVFSWWTPSCMLDVKVHSDGWIEWESTINGNQDKGLYQYINSIPSTLQNILQQVAIKIN